MPSTILVKIQEIVTEHSNINSAAKGKWEVGSFELGGIRCRVVP